MTRNIPVWENQVTFYYDLITCISRSLRLRCSSLHLMQWHFDHEAADYDTLRQAIRYAWKTPHKFLETFSKNLYRTTGGTYSSRFLRPFPSSNFLSPQKSRACILKTHKARSRTLKIEKVSGSHQKMTVSPSRKVSHLPFATPRYGSFNFGRWDYADSKNQYCFCTDGVGHLPSAEKSF